MALNENADWELVAAQVARETDSEKLRELQLGVIDFGTSGPRKGALGYSILPSRAAPAPVGGGVMMRTAMGTTCRLVGGLLELV